MDRPKNIELTPQIELIFKDIMRKNGGLLNTDSIVESARDKASPLHEYFTWGDKEAADKWRKREAGTLIESFKIYNEELKINVRAFTSLAEDRKKGDGYRWTTEVLGKPNLREQLIETALAELRATQRRFDNIKELERVWGAVREVEEEVVEKKAKKPSKR